MLINPICVSQAWVSVVCPVMQLHKKESIGEEMVCHDSFKKSQESIKDESDFEICLHNLPVGKVWWTG